MEALRKVSVPKAEADRNAKALVRAEAELEKAREGNERLKAREDELASAARLDSEWRGVALSVLDRLLKWARRADVQAKMPGAAENFKPANDPFNKTPDWLGTLAQIQTQAQTLHLVLTLTLALALTLTLTLALAQAPWRASSRSVRARRRAHRCCRARRSELRGARSYKRASRRRRSGRTARAPSCCSAAPRWRGPPSTRATRLARCSEM